MVATVLASRLPSILAGTRVRAAATSLVGGLGFGSLFGASGDGGGFSLPVVDDVQGMMMLLIGLVGIGMLGQLFDIQLGGG